VTVLIPAKDEGEGVRGCLDRVLSLDYPNFKVIAIDDRSTDSTAAIFDEYAAKHGEKFKAMHVPHGGLPAGWLGKCNALHTAAAHADGDWLLFVDSDVKVEADSLRGAMGLALGREYDVVSLMTRLECHGFWETLILPLCAASVGAMTLMSLTNDDNRKSMAFANGQFFLIKRSVYESVGGHAAVKDNIVEDVALMRLIKSKGFTTRLFFGRDFASTRMHTNVKQMFHGWARIFSGVSNRRPARIILAMLFVASGLLVYPAMVFGVGVFAIHHNSKWLIAGAAHLAILTIVLSVIYRMSGNPRRYAMAFPIGGGVLLALYAFAVRACRTGRIAWRGTSYDATTSAAPRA
jgi:chlorobactene glucosyltransferase